MKASARYLRVAALAALILGVAFAALLRVRSPGLEPPAASGDPGDAGPAPAASALSPRAVALEREGLRVALELERVDGGEPKPWEEARARLYLHDAVTGEAYRGEAPLAWLARRSSEAAPSDAECEASIRRFMSGQLAEQAEVNLNAFWVLALNGDRTISVINPQVALTRTKLHSLISLPGAPADWALHPSKELLFVSVPERGLVSVVDLVRHRLRGSVPVAGRPTRLALSGDGSVLWVGRDTAAAVCAIDVEKQKKIADFEVGPGRHELVLSDGGRTVWVASSEGEELVALDARSPQVLGRAAVGRGVTSLAASDLAQAVYAASERSGALHVVDARFPRLVSSLALDKGLHLVRADPTGRWVFAVHRAGRIAVIDTASNAVRHDLTGFESPDALTFTERYGYVRSSTSRIVELVQLDTLGKEESVVRFTIPVLQQPASEARRGVLAAPVVPLPGSGGALIAGPADRAIYYYTEGMMAPAGTLRNYGREPLAVLAISRAFTEVRPGVYETTARLKDAGVYDAHLVVPGARVTACVPVTVAGHGEGARAGPPVKLEPLFDTEERLVAGAPAALRFRLTDAKSGEPVPEPRVSVLVFRPPTWQRRPEPRTLGEGVFEVEIVPTHGGQYKVVVGAAAHGAPMGSLRPITLGVDGPLDDEEEVE